MEQIESLRVSKLDDRRRVCFNSYFGGSHRLEAYSPYPFPNQWDSAFNCLCCGAVISGAGGAYKGNESQEAVVKKCLVSRGYKVLN